MSATAYLFALFAVILAVLLWAAVIKLVDLAGRILPDLRDETDLMVPSWPMGDAPIYDGLKAVSA